MSKSLSRSLFRKPNSPNERRQQGPQEGRGSEEE